MIRFLFKLPIAAVLILFFTVFSSSVTVAQTTKPSDVFFDENPVRRDCCADFTQSVAFTGCKRCQAERMANRRVPRTRL